MHRHGAVAGGVRDVRHAGPRDPARRPVPVGRQGVLRLRAGQLVLFPLSAGAAAVLERPRPGPTSSPARPRSTGRRCFSPGRRSSPTCSAAGLAADALAGVRLAASAGEALPAALYQRWTGHFGVDIIDGIGMTEMLHIFLSNAPGRVRPGTTGEAVPGYELKADGRGPGRRAAAARRAPCSCGASRPRPGTGPATTPRGRCSRASGCAPATPTSRTTTATTPASAAPATCLRPAASGSRPMEVEARLLAHEAVAQAVVVAAPDPDGLEKPVAYVILEPARTATEDELIEYCRPALPSFKRPAQGGVRRRLPDDRHRQGPPGRTAPDGREGTGPGWARAPGPGS